MIEKCNELDPKVWGPHYWFVLHTISLTYPDIPNETTKKKYYDFIQNLPLFVPDVEIAKTLVTLIPTFFVDVILPLALPKAYTYQVDQKEVEQLAPGFRIAVPFGKQKMYTAIVARIHQVAPQTYEPKPIGMILDESPSITQTQLKFWSWMASYYMCSMGDVMRACLPAALLLESETLIVVREVEEVALEKLSDLQFIVYEALQKQALVLDDIAKITDKKHVMPLIVDMMQKGMVMIHQKIEEKFKPKKARFVRLQGGYEAEEKLQLLFDKLKRAPKQLEVMLRIFSLKQEKGACH